MKAFIWTVICAVGLLVAVPPALSAAAPQQTRAAVSDETLDQRIEKRMTSDAALKKHDVHVTVNGGVATLTGTVATTAQKARAERNATIAGITRVDNQLVISPAAGAKGTSGTLDKTKETVEKAGEKTKEGVTKAGEEITDAWILTRVKSRFVGENALKDSDINVDCDKHIVTLKGTVMSPAGRAKAVAIAKDTEGVRQVIDHLTIGPPAKR